MATAATAPKKTGSHSKKKRNWLEKKFARFRANRAAKRALIASLTPKQMRKYKRLRGKAIRKVVWRVALSLLTLILAVVAAVYLGVGVVVKGPSQSAGDLLVKSVLETSALKFVPYLYFSNQEVDEIIARNSVVTPQEDTDTSLIEIHTGADEEAEETYEDIEVHEIKGATYRGVMLIVRDPSRVKVGVCRENFNSSSGLQLYQIAEKYGAIAALNGGGFEDGGGTGNGGRPLGVVISNGKLLSKYASGDCNIVIGFDQNNKLVVGEMNGSKAMKLGLRDAVAFSPALVVNGEPAKVSGSGSGYNPRSAIGQRADGAVLMLVIEGRHVNSLGATISDLIGIMLEYGAINAANLDGGSSSMLYYKGEYLNEGVVLTGSRNIPTAFIVQ